MILRIALYSRLSSSFALLVDPKVLSFLFLEFYCRKLLRYFSKTSQVNQASTSQEPSSTTS
ncbi:hypothetical protein M422DRAFT_37956 [Sphaerobolus stellatus SS14]|uniref:Uncharacterized protein n=1 Tax=Sphaerobolus stellatus (strain SS14) TaxID=990650 RepID=A0A0C9UD15_SPHS4|nr:hypothetical protein M422DRAFT_37956 [Sphaerobolus stellatus SS14]